MLKIFELELAKSRRRKRLFNKAFKIFKEKSTLLLKNTKLLVYIIDLQKSNSYSR